MIGLDTVFFTREGFKKLSELNLYDEVLTPLGMFQPIMKMSKIEDVDYYIKTSTDEIIKCSSDMMLPLYNENHTERMVCVSCIKDKKYYTTKILPYDSKLNTDEDLYKKGTEIPRTIDNKILTLSSYYRYELFCGLIDTPMCELKGEDGIYSFKPHSYDFERGLVALARLFGFAVKCSIVDKHRVVKVGIQNVPVIDNIPIRDEYRDITKMPPGNRYGFMPVTDNGKLKEKVKGRAITVRGGLALVGYSLIPVECQIV